MSSRNSKSSDANKKRNTGITVFIIILIVIIVIVILVAVLLYRGAKKKIKSGIAETCTASLLCSKGLTCVSGTCTCLQPDAPKDLTMTSSGPGQLSISWGAVPGADSYIFALNSGTINLTAISSSTRSYTYTTAPPGTYNVIVYSVSTICGYNLAKAASKSLTIL